VDCFQLSSSRVLPLGSCARRPRFISTYPLTRGVCEQHQRRLNGGLCGAENELLGDANHSALNKTLLPILRPHAQSTLTRKDLVYSSLSSAFIGVLSTFIATQMYFYPLEWKGITTTFCGSSRIGSIGWQGIVPLKRNELAKKLVVLSTSKVLQIDVLLRALNTKELALILASQLSVGFFRGWIPVSVLEVTLRPLLVFIIPRAHKLINIPELLAYQLVDKPDTLVKMLQSVGRQQFQDLMVTSCGVGFVVGALPLNHLCTTDMLPLMRALSGMTVNWIAVKSLFFPLTAWKFGPFSVHGSFLKHQQDISQRLAVHFNQHILRPDEIWKSILNHSSVVNVNDRFRKALFAFFSTLSNWSRNHQLMAVAIQDLFGTMFAFAKVQETLSSRLNALKSREFVDVIRPLFVEDEIGMVLVGGIVGLVVGSLQHHATHPCAHDCDARRIHGIPYGGGQPNTGSGCA
jgi:hypothetical protein